MNARETHPADSGRPLAISLLLGASGWFAGIFVLILVALAVRPDSAAPAAITGVVLLAAAWGLFMAASGGLQIVVVQLALALSIAGQCLVVFAAADHAGGIGPAAAAALLLQIVLAFVMPDRLHRTLSTLFATVAWALTVRFALFDAHAGWRDDAARPTFLPAALGGWLLTWGPIAGALWWAIRHEAAWVARGWVALAQPIVTGLIAGLAFATLASQPFDDMRWFGAHASDGSQALFPVLSALAALAALAAAFAQGRRALMALCAIAALLHASSFYYALGASLLVKSLLMLVAGVACLAAARMLRTEEQA